MGTQNLHLYFNIILYFQIIGHQKDNTNEAASNCGGSGYLSLSRYLEEF